MPRFVQSRNVSNAPEHAQPLRHRLDPQRGVSVSLSSLRRYDRIRFDGCDLSPSRHPGRRTLRGLRGAGRGDMVNR